MRQNAKASEDLAASIFRCENGSNKVLQNLGVTTQKITI
jgi:hypothetical protein